MDISDPGPPLPDKEQRTWPITMPIQSLNEILIFRGVPKNTIVIGTHKRLAGSKLMEAIDGIFQKRGA